MNCDNCEILKIMLSDAHNRVLKQNDYALASQNEIEALRNTLKSRGEDIITIHDKYLKMRSDAAQKDETIKELQEKIAQMESNNSQVVPVNSELKDVVIYKEEYIASLEAQLDDSNRERDELQSKVNLLSCNVEKQTQDIEAKNNIINELRAALVAKTLALDNARAALDKSNGHLKNTRDIIKIQNKKMQRLSRNGEQSAVTINDLCWKLHDAKIVIADNDKTISILEEELTRTRQINTLLCCDVIMYRDKNQELQETIDKVGKFFLGPK